MPAHLENAVPRWWRSEVLGTTVVGDGAEGLASLDGEEVKRGKNKTSKKAKRSKPMSPTSPTLSTMSENQRGLTKEEISKIQAKAMKVSSKSCSSCHALVRLTEVYDPAVFHPRSGDYCIHCRTSGDHTYLFFLDRTDLCRRTLKCIWCCWYCLGSLYRVSSCGPSFARWSHDLLRRYSHDLVPRRSAPLRSNPTGR
jgi:hypothetical protein